MFIDMTGGRPIRCSKCGSTNAVNPVNQRDIAIKCGDCGHFKLTDEAERRQRGDDPFKMWTASAPIDSDPKF